MASVKFFECNTCEKSFARKCDLQRHILMTKSHRNESIDSVHEETKKFKCKKCNKGFARKDGLKQHMEGVHAPGKLPSKCNICNARFADAYLLSLHMTYEHTKRPVYKATPSKRQLAREKREKKKSN